MKGGQRTHPHTPHTDTSKRTNLLYLFLVLLEQKKITMDDFKAFDIDGDGKIERSEFIVRKLMLMGLVNRGDVSLCESEFTDMDVDGSGEITFEDLEQYLEKRERPENTTTTTTTTTTIATTTTRTAVDPASAV